MFFLFTCSICIVTHTITLFEFVIYMLSICSFCQASFSRYLFRNSHQRCFVKNVALKNFAKFTGKHLCRSCFFNKVADLRPATLLKIRTHSIRTDSVFSLHAFKKLTKTRHRNSISKYLNS